MAVKLGLIFVLPWIAFLLVGCGAIVSGRQQSKNILASSAAVVDGVTLSLSSNLRRLDKGQRKFDLAGKLTILSTNNSLPRNINLYHMALRPARRG